MASEKLQIILELVTGNYKREAQQAATATGRIGDQARTVTSRIGAMIGPAAIGGAIVGLGNMAVKAGENADRLFDLASQTGLSTDALQEWEFVAKTAGAGTEVFSDAVKAVIKNLNEAEGATGAAGKAYETLGINVLDASGNLRDAGAITDEVFTKLAGMENITARNALAQDIFGKKWEETISILDLGADALANTRGEAHELGAVISEDSLRGADAFRETWEKLKTTLSAKLMETLGKLGPTLVGIAEAILEVVDAADPLLDLLPEVTQDVEKFGDSGGGINVLSSLFGGLSDDLDDQLLKWDEAMNRVILFGDEGLIALDKTGKFNDKLGEAADRARFMADALKDDAVPALKELEEAQRDTATATQIHVDAIIALTNRMAAAINPALGALQAVQDLEEAQDDAAQAAIDFGEGSDEANEAQLRLAYQTAVTTGVLLTFRDDAGGSARAVADALGITEQAAHDLLVELGLLPTSIPIEILLRVRQVNLLEQGVIPEGLGLPTNKTITTSAGTRRQHGGSVWGGRPYLVGERGPELFVPQRSGSIVSNEKMRGGQSNTTIVVQSPMKEFRQDLQYATVVASLVNLVEGV